MMSHPTTQFNLKIQTVKQTALFTLTWTNGLPIDAQVAIAPDLLRNYQLWRKEYYQFYQTVDIPLDPGASIAASEDKISKNNQSDSGFRGRPMGGGTVQVQPQDNRKKLVTAEIELLHSFHQWLRREELHEIREQLTKTSRDLAQSPEASIVDLLITFPPTSADLARLPWEDGEIGSGRAPIDNIRIARAPINIHQNLLVNPAPNRSLRLNQPLKKAVPRPRRKSRKHPRILVILGKDTGLNLQQDLDAIHTLKSIASIHSVGGESGVSKEKLLSDITGAIADPKGWDILFFAGHSSEMKLGGGELEIGPKMTIALKELEFAIKQAQDNGLRFAFFNSCNGLDIAATLIDWGLSQVAVMREKIHNRVAQSFLIQFLESLADHKDVHEALLDATGFLKSKANLTYPSAHLIPTLFRHPQSTLYRIEPKGLKSWWQRFIPTRYEAIALGSIALFSLFPAVQHSLLDGRTWVQAQYRQTSGRATAEESPPIILVRIDNKSLEKANLLDPEPMSQKYLADVIRSVAEYQPKLVGVDYLLDRPHKYEARVLQAALSDAMAQGTQFVFAALFEKQEWQTISSTLLPRDSEKLANAVKVDGDINLWRTYMSLPNGFRQEPRPFAYELARLQKDEDPLAHARTQRSPLTVFSYSLSQRWMDPIVDYSIPPKQVYEEVPAWTLMPDSGERPPWKDVENQVILIVPNYTKAGVPPGSDNQPAPLAMRYWYARANPNQMAQRTITGGERHAYQLHHLLTQRLVIPLPDIAFIFMAAVLGKGVILLWTRQLAEESERSLSGHSSSPYEDIEVTSDWGAKTRYWTAWGIAGTVLYGVFSLEVYLSSVAVLIPIMLPTLTFWLYLASVIWKTRNR